VNTNQLNSYLFKGNADDQQDITSHFTPHGLGLANLKREEVIAMIRNDLCLQMNKLARGPYNIYLSGMRASGKTQILLSLARQLQNDGYLVYFFRSAKQLDDFPRITGLRRNYRTIKTSKLLFLLMKSKIILLQLHGRCY
jgi:DNA replication protein DnaC